MYRTWTIRLYPTNSQIFWLEETASIQIFVFNTLLELARKQPKMDQFPLSSSECVKFVSLLQKKYKKYTEVDSSILEQFALHFFNSLKQSWVSNNQLPQALQNATPSFFLKTGAVESNRRLVLLPDKSISIKYRDKRSLPTHVSSLNFFRRADKWFVSLLVKDSLSLPQTTAKKAIGIDMGLHDFCIGSDGFRIPNPRFMKQHEQKIRSLQRKLASLREGTNNYKKCHTKLQRAYQHVYHSRMNFLHKISSILVKRCRVICIESISLKDMASQKKFQKSVYDVSWGIFVNMLRYKAKARGVAIVEIDRYFASSQICSSCGAKQRMSVEKRVYKCLSCGMEKDRDVNAAENILHEGMRIFQKKKGIFTN